MTCDIEIGSLSRWNIDGPWAEVRLRPTRASLDRLKRSSRTESTKNGSGAISRPHLRASDCARSGPRGSHRGPRPASVALLPRARRSPDNFFGCRSLISGFTLEHPLLSVFNRDSASELIGFFVGGGLARLARRADHARCSPRRAPFGHAAAHQHRSPPIPSLLAVPLAPGGQSTCDPRPQPLGRSGDIGRPIA